MKIHLRNGFKSSNLDFFHNSTKVSSFIDNSICWDIQKLRLVLLEQIVKEICSIPLPFNRISDKLFWGLSLDGCYSAKTGSWVVQRLHKKRNINCQFKWIWKLYLPSKILNFIWEICVDGFPTKEKLYRSHIFVP